MRKRWYYKTMYGLLRISFLKKTLFFKKSLNNIQRVQEKKILDMIKRNKDTKFGKKFGFCKIKTMEDFRKKVPLTDYEFYKNYINDIMCGEKGVLTKDEVFLLEPSSGTTSASKFIPYTQSLKEDFHDGLYPWLFALFGIIGNGTMYSFDEGR